MKRKVLFILIAGLMGFVVLFAGFSQNDCAYSTGAPPKNTNSPGDGQNCTHCMGGTATAVTGWITSDVPAAGYKNDSIYNITVTATGAGNKGFEVSPQDPAGNLLGTLFSGTGSQLVGNGKYVTHTSPKTGSSASWTFQWKAPSSGNDDITFYGSIAVTKPVTKTTTLTITKNTVGINDQNIADFNVSPNPARNNLAVDLQVLKACTVRIELLDLAGKSLTVFNEESCPAGLIHRQFTLSRPAGIYLLKIQADHQLLIKKIIVE